MTDSRMHAIPVALPVQVLEYSRERASGLDPVALAHFRRYARASLVSTIFSGLCVGVACLWLTERNLAVSLLHLVIFSTTLVFAAIAGRALVLSAVSARVRACYVRGIWLDWLAAAGLIPLAVMPILAQSLPPDWSDLSSLAWWPAGAYFLLTVSVGRHVLHYRQVTILLRALGNTYIGELRFIGWIKMIFEGVWLGACTFVLASFATGFFGPFFGPNNFSFFAAFVALLGCYGYGALWVWLIVRHALLVARLRRA